MAFSLGQIGSHEVQVIITVTLLLATSASALLCDYLRVRMYSNTALAAAPVPEVLETAIAPTLVPEDIEIPATASADIPMYVAKPDAASRLALALKQPRRLISREAQEIIERTALAASNDIAPAKKTTEAQKKRNLQRVG